MAPFDTIQQHLLPTIDSSIPQRIALYPISTMQIGEVMKKFVHDATSRGHSFNPIGVSYTISSAGYTDTLALADSHSVFCVDFRHRPRQLTLEFKELLAAGGAPSSTDAKAWCLVGFSFARTAVQLHQATNLRVRGVDLSTLFSRDTWKPDHPAAIVQKRISKSVDTWSITSLWAGPHNQTDAAHQVALQAWLAASVAIRSYTAIHTATKVDSTFLSSNELRCLSQMIAQSDLSESHTPREISSEFTSATLNKEGKYAVSNARYKTRIRRSELSQVVMTDADGKQHVGSASRTVGRQTHISVYGSGAHVERISSIKVIGRQEPTNSERSRDEMIHLLLTGKRSIRTSVFVQTLWLSMNPPICHDISVVIGADIADSFTANMKLNNAQRSAVKEIVGHRPIAVIHGPPGTGKTTTIAAASKIWTLYSCPVWVVAQSNVAVKNIAETLFKKEVDFRLIVSKEFYDEWHEHLYKEVVRKLIRSDELPRSAKELRYVVGSSQIMLCTLSMISNPALEKTGTFEVIPMKRLIVDEASQINVFDFMHIFERFQKTLEKVIFVGDPKQLPPFGRDNVTAMKTIFDLEATLARNACLFLDTQYRMPVQVGNFISKVIYGGRLKSQHPITDSGCVAFIDVPSPRGQEQKQGVSWKNQGEIDTIINLVKLYYKTQNFCVITPYDAQRAAIQRTLEAARLPSDSVYNVDSFQGNEADYVLVSVVRSSRQQGFLASENRMNVLLTRCRKGMVIVSSRAFMAELGGAQTVLGSMHRLWVGTYNARWVDWRHVSSGVADLPGAPGSKQTLPVQVAFSKPSPIPSIYCGPSGGFNVKSLFRSLPHTQRHPLVPSNDPEAVLGPQTRIDSGHIARSRAFLRPAPDIACSIEFPALTVTKTPILPGTWASLQVVRPANGVSEYSLLPKKPATLKKMDGMDEKYTQTKNPSRRPVKEPVGAPGVAHSRKGVAAPAQSIMTRTTIYQRRH